MKTQPRTYTLEKSQNGKDWQTVARFREGDDSRFNAPFSDQVALQEAYSFRAHAQGSIKHIRIIIEIL